MSARTRKAGDLPLGLLVAFFGGAALMAVSFFVTTGHDRSQEATVGIITQHGLPIPFAFTAPGYSHPDFSVAAALGSFMIWAALVFVVFRYLTSRLAFRRSRSRCIGTL
jgi:hypothetical protein